MIESPVLQELKDEWTREAKRTDVLEILVIRFGTEAEGLKAELDAIQEPKRLQELMKFAVLCRWIWMRFGNSWLIEIT